MNILKLAEKVRHEINPESLYPAIAVVAFELEDGDMVMGEVKQVKSYDLAVAIATLFEHEHENTTWEDHEASWEYSLCDHTRKMIRIHNIQTKN